MELNYKKILKDILIFDAHCDTADKLIETSHKFEKNKGHLDLEKIIKGGLKAQIFALWVNPTFSINNPSEKALDLLFSLDKNIFSKGYGNKVKSINEMNLSLNEKNLACWIFIEGGHIIENSLDKIDLFHSLGIKGITITHNKNTDWADSSSDEPKWGGINKLGNKIIKELEEKK